MRQKVLWRTLGLLLFVGVVGGFFGGSEAWAVEWYQEAELYPATADSNTFGQCVALDGTTAVGTDPKYSGTAPKYGSAHVWEYVGGAWVEGPQLDRVADTGDTFAKDMFGTSVALEGDTIMVGALKDMIGGVATVGSVTVFGRDVGGADNWGFAQKLTPGDATGGNQFGAYGLDFQGSTAVIGAVEGPAGGTGSAYVFTESGGTWSQAQKLAPSDGVAGDYFGMDAAVDGTRALVGNGGQVNAGKAYIFDQSGGTWSESAILQASDGVAENFFGEFVDVEGSTAVVSARFNDGYSSGTSKGAVYVFTESGGVWTESQKLTASDGQVNDEFGSSLALCGDLLVVGAQRHDEVLANDDDSGALYIFENIGGTWTEVDKVMVSATIDYGLLGCGVDMDGTTILGGSRTETYWYWDEENQEWWSQNEPGGAMFVYDVPEPSMLSLMGLAAAVLLAAGARRKS